MKFKRHLSGAITPQGASESSIKSGAIGTCVHINNNKHFIHHASLSAAEVLAQCGCPPYFVVYVMADGANSRPKRLEGEARVIVSDQLHLTVLPPSKSSGL